MRTWIGSPSGADLTTLTATPGTTPVCIKRSATAPSPETEITRARAPKGVVSSVTINLHRQSLSPDEIKFQFHQGRLAATPKPQSPDCGRARNSAIGCLLALTRWFCGKICALLPVKLRRTLYCLG